MLVVLKLVENRANDKIFYSKANPLNGYPTDGTGTGTDKINGSSKVKIWRTPPKYTMGSAPETPHHPRQADQPYPVWEINSAPAPAAARRAMVDSD